MDLLIGLIFLLLANIIVIALPALLAAWLFTLVLPIPFYQVMWLALGVVLVVRYVIQNLTDIPGSKETDLIAGAISLAVTFILLALSGLFGWLLLQLISLDISIFEAVLLFVVSLTSGLFFMARSGTGGLPTWMAPLPDLENEFEEDIIVSPPKRSKRHKSRRR